MAEINTNQIPDKQTGIIEGVVLNSYLSTIDLGDAASVMAQRQRGNLHPIDKPHTRLTIGDPVVIPANPQALTPMEMYLQSRCYVSKKGANAGKTCFSMVKKAAKEHPERALINLGACTDGQTVQQVFLKNGEELKPGTRVRIMARCYANNSGNNGIDYDAVIVMGEFEPVAIGAGNTGAELQNYGLVWNGAARPTDPAYAPTITPSAGVAPLPTAANVNAGVPQMPTMPTSGMGVQPTVPQMPTMPQSPVMQPQMPVMPQAPTMQPQMQAPAQPVVNPATQPSSEAYGVTTAGPVTTTFQPQNNVGAMPMGQTAQPASPVQQPVQQPVQPTTTAPQTDNSMVINPADLFKAYSPNQN